MLVVEHREIAYLLDTETQQTTVFATGAARRNEVGPVAISPDGKMLVEGGGGMYGEKYVRLWDWAKGTQLLDLTAFGTGVYAGAVSPRGDLLAIGGGGYGGWGEASLWTFPGGEEIAYTRVAESPVHAVDFSPDGRVLAVAGGDHAVYLYAVNKLKGPLIEPQETALCAQIAEMDGENFIVPLAERPLPNRVFLRYAWRIGIEGPVGLEVPGPNPVVLTDWDLYHRSGSIRAHARRFERIARRGGGPLSGDHLVFAFVQNPGWPDGHLLKIFSDGAFVAANNGGECLSRGNLSDLDPPTTYTTIMATILEEGLLEIPTEPASYGTDHFGLNFIHLERDGVSHLRTDAVEIDFGKEPADGSTSDKREAFRRVLSSVEPVVSRMLAFVLAANEDEAVESSE